MNDTQTQMQANASKPIKILVVEDEVDANMIFKSILEINTPYEISDAFNGNEALEKLQTKDYDLVLLDIIMPEMNGIDVLKLIKENPDKYGIPKVVMLTNLTSEDSEKSTTEFHADGYITKINMEPDALVREVKKYINKDESEIVPV